VFRASKLRGAVAILAAASSVAVATGPSATAASAQNNDGASTDHKSLCESLHNSYTDLLLLAGVNMKEGHRSDGIRAQLDAKNVRDHAHAEGCAWAARVIPPQKKAGISKPVQTVRANATR
jgi:hypothetical protein